MTTDTARPADLMRQAAREESTETLRQLGGVAALHGWRMDEQTRWWSCTCADGTHAASRWADRSTAWDEADAHRIADMERGHVIAAVTVTLTEPVRRVTA